MPEAAPGGQCASHAVNVQTQPAAGFLFNVNSSVSNVAVSGTPMQYYSAFFIVKRKSTHY